VGVWKNKMAEKYRSELKNKRRYAGGADSGASSARVQQLQDEIDKLALLLAEVKRQSDWVQAAADALGEAVLDREATSLTSRNGSKPESAAAQARTRSKDDGTFPLSAETPQIDRARN
jgi:hypothetical protein